MSQHRLVRSLPRFAVWSHVTPGLCWGCKQVMGTLVEGIYLSTGNQRELITLCVLHQADEGHTSELGQPNLQHRCQLYKEAPWKGAREKVFFRSGLFSFPSLPAEALFHNGRQMREKKKIKQNQNTVFKTKIHFLAVILGFCISCLSINCCQTQDVRSIWQIYTSPAAKCFLKIQGLHY